MMVAQLMVATITTGYASISKVEALVGGVVDITVFGCLLFIILIIIIVICIIVIIIINVIIIVDLYPAHEL